jgi:hypothetical protein
MRLLWSGGEVLVRWGGVGCTTPADSLISGDSSRKAVRSAVRRAQRPLVRAPRTSTARPHAAMIHQAGRAAETKVSR